MRIAYIIPLLFLTGCAGVLDRAISSQTAVSKLRADLGADINLREALQLDIAKKHAELQYVSANGYGCGPDDDEFKKLTQLNLKKPSAEETAERIKLRIKFLTQNYGDLAALLKYGSELDRIIKQQSDTVASLNKVGALSDSVASMVPAQFQLPLKALKAIPTILSDINNYNTRLRLIRLANESQQKLQDARDRIVKQRIHKQMTELERRAFYDWDTCAIDRLVFLRAYRPGLPDYLRGNLSAIRAQTVGEVSSSTIEFVALYETYLAEKQAFVGQLVDYRDDIDAIVEANKKIASLPNDASLDDFKQALNGAAVDTSAFRTSYLAILDAVNSHK